VKKDSNFCNTGACLNASQCLRLGMEDMVQWSLNVAVIIEPHIHLV